MLPVKARYKGPIERYFLTLIKNHLHIIFNTVVLGTFFITFQVMWPREVFKCTITVHIHLATINYFRVILKCNQCEQLFKSKLELGKHIKKVHIQV